MSQEEVQIIPLSPFTVIKPIYTGRNPIYFAKDNESDRQVIIKAFPVKSRINEGYMREKAHLTAVNHPNIIQLLQAVDMANTDFESYEEEVSYLVLEHALHGDLFGVISKHGQLPEVLARTLFRQLIEALGWLHRLNVAHLDVKTENILIDANFNLKVIDFDLSQSLDSSFIESKGTPGYRPPELKQGNLCSNLAAIDVYSAAVVLFIMVTGYPPYTEMSRGYDTVYDAYYKLMRSDVNKFWDVHAKHKGSPNFYSENFKSLVTGMLSENPSDRPSIEEIVNSEWFQGPVLGEEDYNREMKKYFRIN